MLNIKKVILKKYWYRKWMKALKEMKELCETKSEDRDEFMKQLAISDKASKEYMKILRG